MNKYLLLFLLPNLLLTLVSSGPLRAQCNGNLCMTPEPSVNAQDACILPNPAALDCYFGSTIPTSPESFPPSWCTSIENNHFFAFIADAPTVDFVICTYDCSSGNAVQAAVFSSSDCVNFEFVSPCLGNIASGTCEGLQASGLTPGAVYYLMIDGNAGALCNYTINGANPTINGPTDGLCFPDSSAHTYTTSTVSSWTIDPPSAGSIQGNPISASVNVIWNEPGPAQVCAKSLSCPDAPNQCLQVTIGEHVQHTEMVELCQNYTVECAGQFFSNAGNYTVTLPSYSGCDSVVNCIVHLIPTVVTTQNVIMCQGGSAKCAGEEFFAPGNFPVTLSTLQGCDSIVHCLVNVVPTSLLNLGTKYVCQGSCFKLGDSLYCNSGSYTQIFKSYLGCDSIVSFNLVVIPIQTSAAIQAPQGQTITCAHPTLLLQAQNAPNVQHLWKNLGGDTLGTGNSILVNTPGFYFHEVKSSVVGVSCSAQAKMLIKQNSSLPPVTAMGGTIDAAHPTVQLMGHSIISGVTYLWTGPNGFTSSLKKPIVSVPGFYTLTVTNPQTGCTNSITVEVLAMN